MKFLIKNINDFSNLYFKEYFSQLNIYQKRKINKIKRIEDKKLSLLALAIIAKELNIDIKEIYYRKKKPYIKNNKYISITHKNPFVGIAISDNCIGIDLEVTNDINKATLNYLQCQNSIEALIKWTRIESAIKRGNNNQNKKYKTIIINKKIIVSLCF